MRVSRLRMDASSNPSMSGIFASRMIRPNAVCCGVGRLLSYKVSLPCGVINPFQKTLLLP